MKTLLSRTRWFLPIILAIIGTSACQLPGGSQVIKQDPDQIPDPDTFDLPEIKVEVEIPDDIIYPDKAFKDPEFILILKIHRIGHLTHPDENMVIDDTITVEAGGVLNVFYGLAENGKQIMTTENEACVMTCDGKVAYRVQGGFVKQADCRLKMIITPSGYPSACTSSCLPSDIVISSNTFAGALPIDPLDTNLANLARGVRTEEVLGNMHWVSTYTLLGVAGKLDDALCEYEDPSSIP